jgi:glucosamine--fructose-6-phosphate aminotransferase (isomerizing)
LVLTPYRHALSCRLENQVSPHCQRGIEASRAAKTVLRLHAAPPLIGVAAPELFRDVRSVLILACGTSYHAGLGARYWIK